jgi:AcrR family transcriptional regulator
LERDVQRDRHFRRLQSPRLPIVFVPDGFSAPIWGLCAILLREQHEKPETLRREPLLTRLRQAFLEHGYDDLTMVDLAPAIGMSRRMLYNHFSNKAVAFRYMLWHDGNIAIEASIAAGRKLVAESAKPLDILVTVMDVRYADNRRKLATSPHALEINDKAFRLARDIMIEAATVFQDRLGVLLGEMVDERLLSLKPGVSADALAQMLCDGARGSNQTLPPLPIDKLPQRYREIMGAILYGTAKER